MDIGQPSVHREHGHFDSECREEGEEHQGLRQLAQGQLVPGQDVKTATCSVVQVDDGDQGQQRTQQGVQEELEGRVNAVGAAPDTNDQVHGDQRGFKKDVEQQPIQRRKHANHQAGQNQEGPHVLVHALLDVCPRGNHHNHGNERRQRYKPERQPIHAEVVVNTKAFNPQHFFHKLHLCSAGIKSGDQRDGYHQSQQSTEQGQPAHSTGLAIASQCQ